jgi:hypothetical protein
VQDWLNLEGVAVTAPFLDRRFIRAALAGMNRRTTPAPRRAFIASVMAKAGGGDVRTKDSHLARVFVDTLRRDTHSSQLFAMRKVTEVGLVDSRRTQAMIADFRAGNNALDFSIWRLASIEAWLESFFDNPSTSFLRHDYVQTTRRNCNDEKYSHCLTERKFNS